MNDNKYPLEGENKNTTRWASAVMRSAIDQHNGDPTKGDVIVVAGYDPETRRISYCSVNKSDLK